MGDMGLPDQTANSHAIPSTKATTLQKIFRVFCVFRG